MYKKKTFCETSHPALPISSYPVSFQWTVTVLTVKPSLHVSALLLSPVLREASGALGIRKDHVGEILSGA